LAGIGRQSEERENGSHPDDLHDPLEEEDAEDKGELLAAIGPG
jgi:hypothetical protein